MLKAKMTRYHVHPAVDSRWEIPLYSVTTFRRKTKPHCICVFVLNEGERIKRQLISMKSYARIVDIVIADGGSTDGALSSEILKSNSVSALLVKQSSGMLSAQMRMAFAWAISKGYKGIITIDGNNKDDPEAIPRFIQTLKEGYDHVQGSRYIAGGKAINTPLLRSIGLRYIHAPLIRFAAGFPYTDTTNGFRAYSRRLLTDASIQIFRDIFRRYELHYYLAIKAVQCGYKVKEIPVTRRYPKTGAVPTKISLFRGSLLILTTLLKVVLHRYDVH